MNKYIIYSIEGFCEAPDGTTVDNCQVLGRACGKDEEEAILNLTTEHPWIEERGFEPSGMMAARLHDDERV